MKKIKILFLDSASEVYMIPDLLSDGIELAVTLEDFSVDDQPSIVALRQVRKMGGAEFYPLIEGWENPSYKGMDGLYKIPPEIEQKLPTLNIGDTDIVVVGNNRGYGLKKVELLPQDLRRRAIVVWNEFHPSAVVPYQALGVERFGSRSELGKMIREMALTLK